MPASAAPAEHGGASLASLPDSALVAIFSKCTMSERLQRLSLVCKEWRDLCATPKLVSKVAVDARGSDALQRMRSLQPWLKRHWGPERAPNAAAVEELTLWLGCRSGDAAEMQQLIAAAAASCGPRLRKLEIQIAGQHQLILSSWLCGITGLTQLRVGAAEVKCSVSLAGLTALNHLGCAAGAVAHPTGSWLPPNLTSLTWGITHLPEQATSLQRLQLVHLHKSTVAVLARSTGVVARLAPSFRSLKLDGSLPAVPPELAALSGQLQGLVLLSTHPAVVDIGSVSGLTSLTALHISAAHGVAATTGLQLLSRLRHLYICNGPPNAEGPSQLLAAAPPDQPMMRSLPPGAWLGGLTHLTLSYDVLFGSLHVLPAATSLQGLTVLRLQCMPAAPPSSEQPCWATLRFWLCSHPPLRRLALHCLDATPVELLELVLALAQRRPGLAVECHRTFAGIWQ